MKLYGVIILVIWALSVLGFLTSFFMIVWGYDMNRLFITSVAVCIITMFLFKTLPNPW